MDAARYIPLFVTDAREHLAQLETAVVALESASTVEERRPILDEIFRHLHSIKGAAATLAFETVAALAHGAEEVVQRVREEKAPADETLIDLLLAARDELHQLVERVAAGEPLPATTPNLAAKLAAHAARKAPPPPQEQKQEQKSPAPNGPLTRVVVRLDPRSPLPAARAFLALRKLSGIGTVVSSQPGLAELKQGSLPDQTLTVLLEGTHEAGDLHDLLARVRGLGGVEASPVETPVTTPPAPAAPVPLRTTVPAAEQWVRVKMDLLDELLEVSSEMVLASSRLRERTRHLPPGNRDATEREADRLRLLVKQLNGRVLAARQAPLRHLADQLPRAVRDLSRRLGKPLTLEVEGTDITLDRGLIEALTDPLLHVLRNAADHGIETIDERVRRGKSETGRMVFAARRERDRVEVEIRDDGAGFDVPRLRRKAVALGALTQAEAQALSDRDALRLAFLPGMTTRELTSEVSGRGVGMDAVERAIEQMGGTVMLFSTPGEGSCVRLVLPTTVSVVNLLLVGVADEVFGVPLNRVLSLADASPSTAADGSERVDVGSERIPSLSLGELLAVPHQRVEGKRPHLVVESAGRRAALRVDSLLGQEEAVLRPLARPFDRIRGLSGTAILGSGRPVVVLDLPKLVAA